MSNVKTIALTSMFIAMITLITMYGMIPIAWGYLNLGDSIIMLLATVLAPTHVFIVGSVGSALADVFLGYSQYALFTFFIKGFEGIIVGYLFVYFRINAKKTIPFLVGGLWIAIGYGAVDAFLYSDWGVGVASTSINLIQGLSSAIIAGLLTGIITPKLSKLLKNNASYR